MRRALFAAVVLSVIKRALPQLALYGVEKLIVIDTFHGVCPGSPNLPVQYTEFKVGKNDNGETSINMTIVVKEDVTKPLKTEISIIRCEKTDKSKCANFKTVKKPNYCSAIDDDSRSPLHNFFRAIKPRWKCPLRKGTYRAVEATIDTSMLVLIKVEDYYWKFKSQVLEQVTGKQVLCVSADLHFEVLKSN